MACLHSSQRQGQEAEARAKNVALEVELPSGVLAGRCQAASLAFDEIPGARTGRSAKSVCFPDYDVCSSDGEEDEDEDDAEEGGSRLMCKTLTESTKAGEAVDLDAVSDSECGSEASSGAESDWDLLAAAAEAVSTAQLSGDKGCLAQALYWKTEALMQRGAYHDACESAERAASLFREVRSNHGEARALLACSALSGIAGRPNEALAQAGMALALARLCGDEALEAQAWLTHRGCLALHGGQEDFAPRAGGDESSCETCEQPPGLPAAAAEPLRMASEWSSEEEEEA